MQKAHLTYNNEYFNKMHIWFMRIIALRLFNTQQRSFIHVSLTHSWQQNGHIYFITFTDEKYTSDMSISLDKLQIS